ncbi:MAG: hypothetical protein U0234_32095 [Sandaracinus sp.]
MSSEAISFSTTLLSITSDFTIARQGQHLDIALYDTTVAWLAGLRKRSIADRPLTRCPRCDGTVRLVAVLAIGLLGGFRYTDGPQMPATSAEAADGQ